MREIIIKPCLNGYICQVGCQFVVFQGRDQLLLALGDYLIDPKGIEKRFLENAVNPMQNVVEAAPERQPSAYVANTASLEAAVGRRLAGAHLEDLGQPPPPTTQSEAPR